MLRRVPGSVYGALGLLVDRLGSGQLAQSQLDHLTTTDPRSDEANAAAPTRRLPPARFPRNGRLFHGSRNNHSAPNRRRKFAPRCNMTERQLPLKYGTGQPEPWGIGSCQEGFVRIPFDMHCWNVFFFLSSFHEGFPVCPGSRARKEFHS